MRASAFSRITVTRDYANAAMLSAAAFDEFLFFGVISKRMRHYVRLGSLTVLSLQINTHTFSYSTISAITRTRTHA